MSRTQDRLRVLVVDDEADVRLGLRLLNESLDAEVREAASGEQALEVLGGWTPHVMLTDITMDGMSGMELLKQVNERLPDVKVLMITGYGTIELAVEAMRRGAAHFITKPFDNAEILAEVERHGRGALIAERVRRLKADGKPGPATIITGDPRMSGVLDLIEQVGPTEMPVLINGESGTGKEMVGALRPSEGRVHRRRQPPGGNLRPGPRRHRLPGRDRPHVAGVSGQAAAGLAATHGGPSRVEHSAARVFPSRGGDQLSSDRADRGRQLPPGPLLPPPGDDDRHSAAARASGDVAPLAMHFIALYSDQVGAASDRLPRLTDEALEELCRHSWPGNVRELENSMQRALILCRGEDIRAHHLRLDEEDDLWSSESFEGLSYEDAKQKALQVFQRRIAERALGTTQGNVTRAAEMCGLTRAAFQRIMRSLNLDRDQFTGRP